MRKFYCSCRRRDYNSVEIFCTDPLLNPYLTRVQNIRLKNPSTLPLPDRLFGVKRLFKCSIKGSNWLYNSHFLFLFNRFYIFWIDGICVCFSCDLSDWWNFIIHIESDAQLLSLRLKLSQKWWTSDSIVKYCRGGSSLFCVRMHRLSLKSSFPFCVW